MPKIKVKIQTFKPSGKYYSEDAVEVECTDQWYYILESVRELKALGKGPQPGMIWLPSPVEPRNDDFPVLIGINN